MKPIGLIGSLALTTIGVPLVGCHSSSTTQSQTADSLQPTASAREAPSERVVTLAGCVGRTGDPDVFVFAVPGKVARTVRGIGTGRPVPSGSEAGPAPAVPPTSIPPKDPVPAPFEPEGRFSTPTIRNFSYRLEGDGGADLASMIGKTVEITGMLPTEGYPSGDLPQNTGPADSKPEPLLLSFRVRSVKVIAEACRAS